MSVAGAVPKTEHRSPASVETDRGADELVIQPRRGWIAVDWRELWRSRIVLVGAERRWQEMADAADAFARRDKPGVLAAISDDLADSIALVGSEGEVQERLTRYVAAGVTSPSVCALEPTRQLPSLLPFARRKD